MTWSFSLSIPFADGVMIHDSEDGAKRHEVAGFKLLVGNAQRMFKDK